MSSTTSVNPTETMLRRYNIVPGHWEPFLEVWRKIVAVRRRHGFTVVLALADKETDTFTWVLTYPGDIDAAAEKYYADPDRVALEYVADHVQDWQVSAVESIALDF